MKLLAPLRKTEQRYSLGDYLTWYQDALSMGASPAMVQTTWTGEKTEPISDTFVGFSTGGLKGNGVVFGLERIRVKVFSQGRFQYQNMTKGRPGELWGDQSLGILEKPWPGGTTGDLLALALLEADLAGNSYWTRRGNRLVRLRPDWVEVILGKRIGDVGGYDKAGFAYYHGGKVPGGEPPVLFMPDEVAHFMPMPDPLFSYRGMSWLTPVVREIEADGAYTNHKKKFVDNAATPNLAVSLPKEVTPAQFEEFVAAMDDKHQGWENAYKTLYTGGGADVTAIGANMQQLDFKVTQGAGETRIALAAGIHPAVAALSEGMQGASLNAGNFSAARRQTGDIEFAHLWQNVAASFETIVPAPSGSRLTIDKRDITFLQDDRKDAADIQYREAQTIRNLLDAGWTAESIKAAMANNDWGLLQHSGLFSVQLQKPGTNAAAGDTAAPAADAAPTP